MKRLLFAFLLPIFCVLFCSSQAAMAQNSEIGTPIETGFAIITPLGGDGQGLGVSEVFGLEVNGILFRSSVLPSPMVTLTSVFTRTDPSSAIDTGLAIVNPNANTVTIVLRLNNDQGITIATRTIFVGGLQQISRFVTELFFGTPELLKPFSGLLFISSDFPVGVLGLTFTGPSFTALPVATQLTPANPTTTVVITGTTNVSGVQTFNAPVNTAGAIPPVLPIPPVPPTITTPLPTTITEIPSTFSNLPPVVPNGTPTVVVTPTTTVPTGGVIVVRGDVVFPVPLIGAGIGGFAAQLLPQVVTGGGWSSTIAIANTTSADQFVRADFFNSQGGPLVLPFGSSVSSILVPAAGVVTLSTN